MCCRIKWLPGSTIICWIRCSCYHTAPSLHLAQKTYMLDGIPMKNGRPARKWRRRAARSKVESASVKKDTIVYTFRVHLQDSIVRFSEE